MHKKPVLEVIADRMFARNSGIEYADGNNLCLAVEGGAMRGIVSCGMLLALYDLDMLDIFDEYVGISAGSLNLAYVLAGQGSLGLSIYFDDMTDKEILNLLRFRSPEHPILNMTKMYLRTEQSKALNLTKLQEKYGTSFKAAVSNVTTNKGELICLNDAGMHFKEFLISGAIVPFIAGDPWIINKNQYYDGGLFYAEPSLCALELGASHTFTLSTQPQDKPIKQYGKFVEDRLKRLDSRFPQAGTHYVEAIKHASIVFQDMPHGETELNGMMLYRHALEHGYGIGIVTTDTEKLLEGVKAGYKSIVDIFYQQGRVGIRPTLM